MLNNISYTDGLQGESHNMTQNLTEKIQLDILDSTGKEICW